MFDKISNWFFSNQDSVQDATWTANTATIQNQQPTSPEFPMTDRVVTEQPNSQDNMKLRGGGAGDVCCGVCAGLLCFECCEDCC
ncbi:uncharacterized protein N7469_007367 [Penicillium citrinum]|uniref:Uncharacterized protein n=2 Tax=Penicillium TaxID=5073 RepID=A0A9W9TLL9_PENCI|nr:uncharacterized protein N7469_007367 [Penicillium citrinum]KAJ5227361.1 hypothetical protein N7469_007367 [Penicillium citrinum]KAJ5568169.1 hypothetical protein N7450_010655 [Penicillium hetheringtonii]